MEGTLKGSWVAVRAGARRRWAARLALAAAALSACGCSSSPKSEGLYCDPPRFEGFPSSGSEDIVYVEARLDPEHENELGLDLLERRIVPVKLSIRLRGAGATERLVRVEPDRWDARLYLLDGTVLPLVEGEKLARDLEEDQARKVRRGSFRPTLIDTEPVVGYVFFALDGKRFQVDGRKVRHLEKGFARPLRLDDSLLAFNLTQGDRIEPYFVGIRP